VETHRPLPEGAEPKQPAALSPDERAALDAQIQILARDLNARPFLYRQFVSDFGAQRIAILVLEEHKELDEAARRVLVGFVGWAETPARESEIEGDAA
jgi:hypothetical protein